MHMRYLTIEQREALQATLNARADMLRADIARALERQNGGSISLPNHREETDDDAIVDLESSLDVAQLSRDSEELKAIEHALSRLHAPEYGQCAVCGTDIPFTRLQANPAALRCVGCQADYERSRGETSHRAI